MPLRSQDAQLLIDAHTFRFGPDQSRHAWMIGQGPLVLLVHGWGGRGVQMGVMARALAAAGFRCIFFDAGGHGGSRSEPVGFHTFINDVGALSEHVGQTVFAYIGHSAGALGMMASRSMRGVRAERYICIAAPRYPYVPLESIKRNYDVSDEVIELVKGSLASQFECDWLALQTGSAYRSDVAGKLMLAYDIDDERVHHMDADRIAAGWPGAHVLKTQGFGHNKILQAPELLAEALSFLQGGAPNL